VRITIRRTMVPLSLLVSAACGAKPGSETTVRRSGDTLFVRLDNGRDTMFIDQNEGESPGGYKYVARIGRPAYHLIESHGHEALPSWILMNARTGRAVINVDSVIPSPDSSLFVAVPQDWKNCTEGHGAAFAIWRLTDSIAVRAVSAEGGNCSGHAGWAALDPRWRGNDTVEFTRIDFPAPPEGAYMAPDSTFRQRRALAFREKGQWVIR
jgi:hypothetical protein